MNGLAIIIADDNSERLRTALVTACAQAALGAAVRIFLQGAAVLLLRDPVADPDGQRQSAAGLPTLGQLFEEAIGMGVEMMACQSSLAVYNLDTSDFDARIEWGGMIGFMSTIEPDNRILVI